MAAAVAFISANAATIGTALSVVGALSQGQQANNAAKYNAAVARNNAIASRQQAAAEAAAQNRKARLTIGAMRAGYGASGVGMEGSPLDILEQSAANAELDRQNILYSGETQARGYDSTAGMELMSGKNAVRGSIISAGTSLLSGAAKAGYFTSNAGVSDELPGSFNTKLRRVG